MDLVLRKGYPQPYGVKKNGNETNFAVFSRAEKMTLCILNTDRSTIQEIELNPEDNRTGTIWHIGIQGLPDAFLYGYKNGYEDNRILLDPYAKETDTPQTWGERKYQGFPLGVYYQENAFDWEDIKEPKIPLQDLVIYEMHVRGFTIDASSNVKAKGKFLGIVEKIPYLLDLGVNCIELLPIQEFNELDNILSNPITREKLYNYWGYSTQNFFCPMNRYREGTEFGDAAKEFKQMVKELHRNGIEVILDVVFNHTGEGNNDKSAFSFKGMDKRAYYIVDPNGGDTNFSGCGNTFNCNHPVSVQFIIDCLRYWALEMKVDGFRFDLASIFTRGQDGNPIYPAPLVDAIADDPLLANKKLIAEPWDAAGLYQVGGFYKNGRWSEWNGKYRDCVRKYIKGTPGTKGEFVTRISGSQDLYHHRSPLSSVNFVTCHDGFSLYDLVSYNHKHNESNGENNRDGTNDNESWNCGTEGLTTSRKILMLREKQLKNFIVALMLSQGVPMILMGDEYGHSKHGNNNTWCHDDSLSWFSWSQLEKRKNIYHFFKHMIAFRKANKILKYSRFLTDQDVHWHGKEPFKPDWADHAQAIAFTRVDHEKGEDIFAAFNATATEATIMFPPVNNGNVWHWIVNTANIHPYDISDLNNAKAATHNSAHIAPYSCIVLKLMQPNSASQKL